MDLTKFGDEFQDQQENFEKDYKTSSGEKFAGSINYTGSYVSRAKTVKYTKDGEIKQFPDVSKDKNGGFRLNMAMEVVNGTENVPVGSTFYIAFPISSKSEDPKKRRNAANMCKGRMLSLAPKEVADSFKLTVEWLENNMLGKFEEKPDESGNFKTIRETRLNDQVVVKFIQEVDQNGRPRLKDDEVRKATPDDVSKEGSLLEVKEYNEESTPTEESAPKFSDDGEGAVDDVISDFE